MYTGRNSRIVSETFKEIPVTILKLKVDKAGQLKRLLVPFSQVSLFSICS